MSAVCWLYVSDLPDWKFFLPDMSTGKPGKHAIKENRSEVIIYRMRVIHWHEY